MLEMNAFSLETKELKARVECVWPAQALLGEGPCWASSTSTLYWTDIKGGRVYAFSEKDGRRNTWIPPCRIGSVSLPPLHWRQPAELRGIVLLACGDFGLMWLGLDSEVVAVPIAHPETHLPENRFNDGKIGPDGRYWAGTMHDPESKTSGSLYAFSPNGEVAVLDSGYRVTNGPAFSPDGTIVYHTDSAEQSVYAFDLKSDGQLGSRRTFLRFVAGEGYPDGMTTDAQGNLWIAMWGGGRVEKISPQGTRLGHIPIPTPRVTSCTFAGEDETVLYVTSASIDLPETETLAGGLFKVQLG
jgi:xylono-1,5-lactonase